MNYTVRPLIPEDEAFLWEMLYQALHVPIGQPEPPRQVVHLPELTRYVQGWGRAGDCEFLATSKLSRCDMGPGMEERLPVGKRRPGIAPAAIPCRP